MDRERSLAGYSLWGHKRVGHDLATKQQKQSLFMRLYSISSLLWDLSEFYCLHYIFENLYGIKCIL